MFKTKNAFFLSLFIGLFSLSGVKAEATSYLMTHEKFVHLSETEKQEIVIQTMELVVRVESQYQYEVRKSGFNSHRFKKYTQLLNTLQNFLISSAHASKDGSWQSQAQAFATLSSSGSDNKCLYGGWVSTLVNVDGKTLCRHPKYIEDHKSAEYKAYAEGKHVQCDGINKISCNPAVFGFRKASTQSLFCVDAGIDNSKNSALECERLALGENNDKIHPAADNKDTRLSMLSSALSANPTMTDSVQNFVFKTCVCDNNNSKSKIDENYRQRIKGHRTCYGMMKMVGDTEISCKADQKILDTSIFDSLNNFTLNSKKAKDLSDNELDDYYKGFLAQIKTSADTKAAYTKICGEVPTTDEYTCSSTCVKKDDKWSCPLEVKLNSDASKEIKIKEDKNYLSEAKNKSTTEVTLVESGKKQTCNLNYSDSTPKYTCSSACAKNGDKWSCPLTVKLEGDNNKIEIDKNEISIADADKDKTTKTDVIIKKDGQKLSCDLNYTSTNDDSDFSCKPDCKPHGNKKSCGFAIFGKTNGTEVQIKNVSNQIIERKDDEKSQQVPVTWTEKQISKTVNCTVSFEETSGTDVPKLAVTLGDKDSDKQTVKASLNEETSKIPSYTIVWSREGTEKIKLSVPTKAKADLAVLDDSKDPTPVGETVANDNLLPTSGFAADDSFSIDEPIYSESYKTCVSLKKDGEATAKDKKCVTIPKKDAATPTSPNLTRKPNGPGKAPPPMMPPYMPTRRVDGVQ